MIEFEFKTDDEAYKHCMLINELVRSINFHDSCINKIRHNNDTILMNIDLCMWQQVAYREGEQEQKEVEIIFLGVTDYNWDSEKTEDEIDYDQILEVNLKDGKIEMILLGDGGSLVSCLSFRSTKAKINYLRL